MTTHFSEPLHVPSGSGREAFAELDRVDWDDLEHAYHQKGTAKRSAAVTRDVAATLRRLGDAHASAMDEPIEALFSCICHQGTIYEATAYAVPFIAAFAAGTALSDEQTEHIVQLLGNIGIAASFEAPRGSHAGSFGPNVGPVTRQAIRSSIDHLNVMALRSPALSEVVEALAALVRTDSPDAAAVAHLRVLTGDEDD